MMTTCVSAYSANDGRLAQLWAFDNVANIASGSSEVSL
jgi:hypothetical protein